jgi:hypothetical protein
MPHPEHDTGAPAASHVDEGTIHAWLDDALSADERRAVEAHVAGCASCAAAVAEARGLVAGASRILSALDGGLGAVSAAPPSAAATPIAAARAGRPMPRRWWATANARAAAALLIVAGGSGILLTTAGPRVSALHSTDSTATQESVADLRVDSQLAMPQSSAALRSAVAFDATHDSVAGPEEPRDRAATRAGSRAGSRAESRADAAVRLPALPSASPAPPVQPSSAVAAAAPPAVPPPAPVAAAPTTMSRGVAGGLARARVGAAPVEAQVLRGVVREAGTQQPVAGATVTIAGAGSAAVTDSSGRFTLRDVPPGTHVAQAQRFGYSADTLRVAVVPGRPAEVRVELQKSTNALSVVDVASARAGTSARGFASSAAVPAPRELAGCYWIAAPAAPAGALPGLVRLDTTVAPDGGFTARLADSAGGQWPPARWTVSGAPADALAIVTVSWRTTLGRTRLDLTRAGRDLTGTARLPGDAEGATPRGVRLVRAACAPGAPPG